MQSINRSKRGRGNRRALMKKNTYETNGNRNNLDVNRNVSPQPSLSVVRLGNGMPDQLWIRMKWHGNYRLESSTAQQAVYLRGNCPYDPDPKLGGDSAIDYQTLQLMYRYARCYGSKITVNGTLINNQSCNFCITPMRQQEAVTFDRLVSDKRTVVSRYITTAGNTQSQKSNYMQTRTIYGLDSIDYDVDHGFDTDHFASPNQSATPPAYEWFWLIYAQNAYNQVGLNISLSITIEYDVKFFSRNYFNTLQTVTGDEDGVLIDDYPDNPGTDITDPEPEPIMLKKK
jgi:hypothetical protein